ncbi:MAG: SDR family NAD(P)-dependent oxidoreductase [Clostridia bacterium]|nr:SDR family NAD(P)-dependent oxidoreductase [Clostridia bacterium]
MAETKTALVTGCDHGLGPALADGLENLGWRVVRCALEAEEEAAERDGRRIKLRMDISRDDSVRAAAAEVSRLIPRLDLLVNNAGILGDMEKTLGEDIDTQEILRVFNVNALGTLRVTNALTPLLKRSEAPVVLNVSSEAGSIGTCWRHSWWGYCMSKAANNMQGAIAHNALRAFGGRVIQMHPGHMATYMRGHLDETARFTPAEAAERILRTLFSPDLKAADEHPLFIDLDGKEMAW